MPISAKGSRRERELLERLASEGWIVHRVAGSGVHDEAVCDLIAVKDGEIHFIEVKSRKEIYYPNSHAEQLKELVKISKIAGAKPLLAVKLNYKPWQLVDISKEIPEKIKGFKD